MSADDFQSKYASVMESMLKSAIAETTKLFETMVDELKAEISQIKKENEDLKTKCIQYEISKSQPVKQTTDRSHAPEQSDASEKCDTAIQCDLGPCRTVLVEQCPPPRPAEMQNLEQQYANARMNYSLLEHNYVSKEETNSKTAFVVVKQEESYSDSSLQYVLKQEEIESSVTPGQVMTNDPVLKEPFVSGPGNKGPVIQECSSEEIKSTPKNEATQVVLEASSLGMNSSLKEAQKQYCNPQDSLVISLKDAFKSYFKEECEVAQKMAETATQEEQTSEKHLNPQESHPNSVTSVNTQNEDVVQHTGVHCTEKTLAESLLVNKDVACEGLKDTMVEAEACSKPNLTVRRGRGRPPKKRKQKQILSASTEVPSGQKTASAPSVGEKKIGLSPVIGTEKVFFPKPSGESTVEPTGTLSVTTPSVRKSQNKSLEKKGEVGSSVSVEQPPSESKQLSKEVKEDATKTQTSGASATSEMHSAPQADSLQTASCQQKKPHTSVSLQDAMLLIEAMNQSTMENAQPKGTEPQTQSAPLVGSSEMGDKSVTPQTDSVQTQLTSKSLDVPPHITNATSTCEVQTCNKVLKPVQQNILIPLSTTQTVASSADATQQLLPRLLVTLGVPSKSPRTIIIVPKPVPSPAFCNSAGLPSSQSPKVDLTAKHKKLLLIPTASQSPVGTTSRYSVPQKTFTITYNTLPSVQPLQATTTSTDKHSETIPKKEMAINTRKVETEIIRKPGIIILRAKQNTTEPTAPASLESSTQLSSMSQESSSPNLDDRVEEKIDDTAENQDSPKPETPVCETIDSPTETCSDSDTSDEQGPTSATPATPVLPPAPAEPKRCAVVRLTRLPFPISAQESISVSRWFPNRFSECICQKPSKSTMSVLGMPVLTPVKIPSVPEMPSTSEESPASRDVQPSMSSTVSEPVVEISDVVSNMMDPSPVPSASDELTSNLSQIFSNEENQSSGRLQLTPITSKDTSYPQLRMTKTQFLAQLSVSPVVQEQETSDNSSADSRETRNCGKKGPPKASIVTRLRSHLKDCLKARRTAGQKADKEMEPTSKSPKKPRLEEDGLNDKNITKTVCNRKQDETDNIASTDQVNTTSLISRGESSQCVDAVTTMSSVGQPASVSCRSEPPRDSTAESLEKPNPSRDGVDPNSVESTSVNPKQSTSAEASGRPKMSILVSISRRRCPLHQDDVSLRNKKSKSVSPQTPSSMKTSTGPKNTKFGSSPKTAKSPSMSPNGSTKEGVIPKKSESPVCLRTSTLTRKDTSPKMPGSPFTSTNKKGDHSNGSIKRASSSFSSGRRNLSTVSFIVNKINSESRTVSVRGHRITKNTSESSGVSTSAHKEPRQTKGRPATTASFKVVKAMQLAKAAKTKRRGKMKMSNNSKRQKKLGENQANNGALKTCRAKVWYPPTLPPNEVPSTEIRKPKPVVVEDKIPLIPFNQTPIVSPLQPLAVIGKHLLRNQCGQCGRVFNSNAALESHVSLHAGYRLYSCSLCGKCFPDSKTFKRHHRVHRNGRIHVCRHCGKGFVYRYGLSKHQQMVHTRIKPFICQICNKGFVTRRDVEVHIRTHTGEKPFKCHLCEKKFARRVELNVHLRWHNGEKRHWCPYCGKGFLDLNNLKRHKYTHTGEKPHSCPRCPKKFTQGAHLKKHLKNVHKEKGGH
ncbi:uncharacterized protein LOC121638170 [Melanotaenia boesemani]|uniref:uncharacterized protein LOC121638170 n=1 Tax=Melanotaenia boesemani TaxID=1250792 RepID=UPI001C0424EE|nr:uncharacterized protein LOC121638170 [Melanotaenia boesemani]